MYRLALLALSLSLAASAQAQSPKDGAKGTVPASAELPLGAVPDAATLPDTIRPGDLDLSGLPLGETTYTVRLLAPMQQDIGSITETMTAADGVITRTSAMVIPMAGQDETSTVELDAGTYAFRSATMDGVTARGTMTLADGRITGERAVAEAPGALPDPVAVDDAPDGPVFGGGWIFAAVRALPLDAPAVYFVETYDSREGLVTERVTIQAPEAIKPAGGVAVTYVPVETFDGEQTMTYYVDAETRDVELVRFSPQPGVEVELDRD